VNAGAVSPGSPIVIHNQQGVRQSGVLGEIFNGTYSVNLGTDEYPWQRNERSPATGDYFDWLGKLGVKNYDESSFIAAVQPKSKGLKKGWNLFDVRQAIVKARIILGRAGSTQVLLRHIKSSNLYREVYEGIKGSVPLLPMSLIRADPFDMPELASLLLRMKYLEASKAFLDANPGSTEDDFESSLIRPEVPEEMPVTQ
jgi:hypothetical protein